MLEGKKTFYGLNYKWARVCKQTLDIIRCDATYQDGPRGFVTAVTHAPGFGLVHFMTVDPAPQLMGQPVNQSALVLHI